MTILHISWNNDILTAWGEQECVLKSEPSAWDVGPSGFPFSPFGAKPDVLIRILSKILWEEAAFHPAAASLVFPTTGDGKSLCPIPSRPFLLADAHGEKNTGKTVTFATWQVPAVHLTWKQAFALFGVCHEKRLETGIFAGDDLLSVAHLFRYTGSLVARGRFLPGIRKTVDGRYEAVWQPALDGTEQRRFLTLAARFPPVAANRQHRLHAAWTLLEEMTDQLVRFSVVTTLSRAQAEHGMFYSAHDAWFAALRGEKRSVRWPDTHDLDKLNTRLRQWRYPVEGPRGQNAVLSFRLKEPETPEEPWYLHVQISTETGNADFPQKVGESAENNLHVGESLYLSLGQACMLFSPLARAGFHAGHFGCELSAEEAHAFLVTAAPLMEAAGYRVRLPEWWKRVQTHSVTLEMDAVPHGPDTGQKHALTDKIDINWKVTLNGEPLDRQELETLLHAQTPLVFFRGRWIQINLRELQDAMRVWQRKSADSHSALEVVQLALGTVRHYGLDVSQVRGAGWLDPFLKQLSGDQGFEVLPAPAAFCGALRPYQVRGYSWLVFLRAWGFGACLADDMGLGKTIQALAFLLQQKAAGEKRPVLLVGPMSVLGNWLHEAQRFAPTLRCLLHHGPQRWHGDSFAHEVQNADVVITSYHLLYRDYTDLRKVTWAGLVLDEAQNIKNPDTHQAQAARALQAEYRIALTGTPLENHVGDIWSIMDFLNPGMLGKRSVFREKFFRPIQSETDPGARSRLRRITAPFILRRLKTDRQIIADLPEKVENKVYCPLTLEQARLYQEELRQFHHDLDQSEGIQRRGLILSVLTRLKQICNHPLNYLNEPGELARRSGKLARLEEMLEETFASGESALVFTQYAEMGSLLKRYLCQTFAREMPFLHGGVPRKERDRLVDDFQNSSEPLAFILSLKAGGTGLNLTRASHVFHYDRWWNPAVENQATDRAFRIGQTRRVLVHKFICGGTLEDRIDAMIEHKTALASEIVTNGEAFLTELSNDELKDVLKLSEAVVADEVGP